MSVGCLVVAVACAGGDDDGAGAPASPTPPAESVGGRTDPTSSTPGTDPTPTAGGIVPEGFTTVTVRITDADGAVCEVCMWLADDGAERGRGLMGVTDLGSAAGMAFSFPSTTDGAFYMYNTPTPLSIAWFAADGSFVSSTDMEPCTTVAADCARYRPDGPYRLALEVFAGGLAELGVEPGSTAELVAGSESPTCPSEAG